MFRLLLDILCRRKVIRWKKVEGRVVFKIFPRYPGLDREFVPLVLRQAADSLPKPVKRPVHGSNKECHKAWHEMMGTIILTQGEPFMGIGIDYLKKKTKTPLTSRAFLFIVNLIYSLRLL